MAKYLIYLISLFFIFGCQTDNPLIETYKPLNKEIFINVVEKKTNLNANIEGEYSNESLKVLKYWIDNKIKTNGFEGVLNINLVKIFSSEIPIDDGIKFQLELEIDFIIKKTVLESEAALKFKGKEFIEIYGDYSILDKEIAINNITNKIIERLSNKLYEKIN